MQKTILLTGATDGIGLETAKMLVEQGHNVLLHGRNPAKLARVANSLSNSGQIETYVADLSSFSDVKALADKVAKQHASLDVLINNAGVFKVAETITPDGLDVRFVVNTIAPYLLTKLLLPLMSKSGRVVNLSSAAQNPVNLAALAGGLNIVDDFEAYAQSKLALTIWSRSLGLESENGPAVIAVNPGSMLNTNMVKTAFGGTNNDISIGANILVEAALSDRFAKASGKYYDNDSGQFAPPHPDGLNPQKIDGVVQAIDTVLAKLA
ncbi:MAG: SDR family NAD(P)-dependent oxidoreductase [Anaerolineae bacterium]